MTNFYDAAFLIKKFYNEIIFKNHRVMKCFRGEAAKRALQKSEVSFPFPQALTQTEKPVPRLSFAGAWPLKNGPTESAVGD